MNAQTIEIKKDTVVKETEKAINVALQVFVNGRTHNNAYGERTVYAWLPKSQCEIKENSIAVAAWLFKKKIEEIQDQKNFYIADVFSIC